MARHSHDFIEYYEGPVGFGMDRELDEITVKYYLQKFSDDALLEMMIPRLDDAELEEIFNVLSKFLAQKLEEDEYHQVFLK